MSLSAAEIFDLIAPELSSNAGKSAFLQMASEAVSSAMLGNNASMAIAYRAAHELTLVVQRPTGEGGSISQKKEGDLSIAYQTTKDRDYWDLTFYGKRYKDIVGSSVILFGVTGGNDIGTDVISEETW